MLYRALFLQILLWLVMPSLAMAKATFYGTDGVYAKVFSSNSQEACTNCHATYRTDTTGGTASTGDDRNGASVGVDFNTYSAATTGTNETRSVYRASTSMDMPPTGVALNSSERSLMTAWESGGFDDSAAPDIVDYDIGGTGYVGLVTAKLWGNVAENGSDTTVRFRYSTSYTSVALDAGSLVYATSPTGSGGGTGTNWVSYDLTGLSCGTTYYYRFEADNAVSGVYVEGTIYDFVTDACTSISTAAVTSATESVAYSYDVNATGGDGSYTFSLLNAPAGMTINSSTGVISWTPAEVTAGYTQSNITVRANDAVSTIAQQTFSITVSANNDAPTFSSSAVTTATEDSAYSYDVNASDVESQTITYSLITAPSGMSINSSTGVISWTPTNAQAGASHSVTVRASDGTNLPTQSFSVSVTAVNDQPYFTTTATTDAWEDTAYSYNVDAGDDDGPSLTFSLTVKPTGMTIDPATGIISWTPTPAQAGMPHNVTVQINDNSGAGNAANTQSFVIDVYSVNDAPLITTTADADATEDTLYTYAAAASDEDSGTLTWSLIAPPSGMSIDPDTGVVSWTPTNAQAGSAHMVTVRVDDNSGTGTATTDQEVWITVAAVNDAPVLTSMAVTAATEDSAYSYNVDASDIDGPALEFSLTTSPAGMTIDPVTGVIDWTPTNAQAGSAHDVTVEVTDGSLTDTQSFSVTVGGVNDAPAISSSALTSATEDAAYSYDVGATDIDGPSIAFSLTTSPAGMSIDPVTGVISWTPTNAQAGSAHDVTVEVSDGSLTDSQSFSVTVSGVNDAPAISTSAVTSATEDVAYGYDVDAADIDGPSLTFSLTVKPTGMTINPSTGVIAWTPSNAQSGTSHNVTVEVSDGTLTDTQAFSISVSAVNDAPAISSSAVTAATEDAAYSYDVNATDVDGPSATFSLTLKPTGMTINPSTGVISWTPTNAQAGSAHDVTVEVNDGSLTGTQSFSVTVAAVNDAPAISSSATTSATEDVAYGYDVNASDVDGPSATFSLTLKPTGMTIDPVTGVIAWTPTNAQSGTSHNVTVEVSDGSLADTQSFSIMVAAVNDAPVISSVAVTGAMEDIAYAYDVNATDVDGPSLTFSLTTSPAGMTISPTTGVIAWTPTNAQSGAAHDVTVEVTDGSLADTQSFSVTVVAENNAPLITSSAVTVASEDAAYAYDADVSDVDSVSFTWSLAAAPAGMAINPSTGAISWTPSNAQAGTAHNVTVEVDDNSGAPNAVASQSFAVSVSAVNDAPAISSVAVTAATEDTAYAYDVDANDVDGPSATFSLTLKPTGMTINPSSGVIAWTPTNTQAGTSHNVTVQVSDGSLTDTQSFSVSVTAVNDAPAISSSAVTSATEDVAYAYDVNATDVDGPSATFSLTASPAGMSINPTTGVIAWTPSNAQSGTSHNVTVQVSDGSLTGTQAFSISVTAVNDAPVISSVAVTAATEDVAYVYDVNASDVDGPSATFSLTLNPAGMTINPSTGEIAWTPGNAQAGASHDVTVRISDGTLTDTQSFSIAVAAVNDAPAISSSALTTASEGVAYAYDVNATDVDGPSLTFSLTASPAGMTINPVSGVIAWTPTNAQAGASHNVTVEVSDGSLTDTQSFSINVAAENDAPVISSTAVAAATEDAAYTYDADVSDIDSGSFTWSLALAPSGMAINPSTGVISWTPTNAQAGIAHNVTLEVDDNSGAPNAVASQSFAVSVSAVNDAPAIGSVAVTTATEDAAYTYDVNATDVDGPALTFSLTVSPAGMNINPSSGVISWTPTNAQAGSAHSVTVEVSDGSLSDTQSFSIDVTAVNDAPVFSSAAITSATEDLAYSYDVNALDIDSGALTYSLTQAPTGMSINAVTGEIDWTPSNAQAGSSHNVTVEASDGSVAVSQSFSIAVVAINDAPLITGTPGTSATEDVEWTHDADVSDVDGPGATFSLSVFPAGMSIDAATGAISWTPTNAQAGTAHNVTIEVDDGSGGGNAVASQSFSVTVTAVNDAPLISSAASSSAIEGSPYSYQVVVVDPDDSGAELAWSLLTAPPGMTVSAGGLIEWTPPNGTTSADVTVQVQDGGENGATPATQSWTITVGLTNTPPAITSLPATTAIEDTAYAYVASATDADDNNNGTDLTWSLVVAPAGMSVSATGTVSWTPTNAQAGASYNVTLRVADGGESGSLPDEQSWSIAVTAVNDAPVIGSSAVSSATEDTGYAYDVNATDIDGPTLTFSLVTAPAGMGINAVSGEISWTPTNAQSGASHNVTVEVSDGSLTDTQAFSVNVAAVNDAPEIVSSAITAATEALAYVYDVNATDIDGPALTFSLQTFPAGMAIDAVSGEISWTPDNTQSGSSHAVTVQVSDGTLSDTQSFSVAVGAVNNAPVIGSSAVTAATEDVGWAYDADASDADSVSLTWTLDNGPAGMTIDAVSGEMAWLPGNGDAGSSHPVTISVSDGIASDTQSFSVTVTAVNDAPLISSVAITAATEDTGYLYDVAATDVDGPALTFSLVTAPAGMGIDAVSGEISWMPTNAQAGIAHNVTVEATDGTLAATQSFAVTVTAVNDAPLISSAAITTATEDNAYAYDVDATDADGPALTFSLVTAPAGMAIEALTGAISWTPSNAQSGSSHEVSVEVSDGSLTATQSFSVAVTAVNDAPVISSSAVLSATESTLYAYDVNATDIDGPSTTFSLTLSPAGMTIDPLTGEISWTPVNAQSGMSHNVTVEVSDGTLVDSESFSILVAAVNDAPAFSSSAITDATEEAAYAYDVDASDVDSPSLLFSLATSPAGMTIDPVSGEIAWTPDEAQAGTAHPVTVEASDGSLVATQSFVITVAAINDAPVIGSAAVTLASEGSAYFYDVNANDSDGPALVYSLTTAPAGMSIDAASGEISWTPGNDDAGMAHNVTVEVSDGTLVDTQSFSINVTAVNDAPVIASSALTAATEDVVYTYDVDATDIDTIALTYGLVVSPAGMTINALTGEINWTPVNAQAGGNRAVTVSVSDGSTSVTQSWTIAVAAVNDAPVISGSAITTATEDTAYAYDVNANDIDSVSLSYALTVAPSGMSIDALSGAIGWTPGNGQSGISHNVTVEVSDGVLVATQSFSVTVTAVNDAPVIGSSAVTVASEDSAYSYDVNASDVDGPALAYALVQSPAGMTIDALTGEISWTPTEAQGGSAYNVSVEVSDGSLVATQAFSINVSAVNDAPVIGSTALTAATEEVAYSYDVDATDVDGPALVFSLSASPAGMTIDAATGAIAWTPTEAQGGNMHPVTVEVTDGTLLAAQSFVITVAAINDAPVIGSTPPTTASEDTAYSYDVNASDSDNASLVYSLTAAPSGMTINAGSGAISWTPSEAQAGSAYNVTVQVSDGVLVDTQAFSISVATVNDAPVIGSSAVIVATEDVAYAYDVDATDNDSALLSYSLTVSPSGMSIDAATGVIGWTPSNAQGGSHGVTVLVSDGSASATQSWTISVASVNDAPVISSAAVTTATEDTAYTYDVNAGDIDNASLVYALTAAPVGMTINAATGVISWLPSNVFAGAAFPVTVSVSDGTAAVTQSFGVTVAAVNDAPVFSSIAPTAATEDVAYAYDADATDVDSTTLSWSLTLAPAGMTINTGSGLVSWTPSEAQSGNSYPVVVRVTDGALAMTQSFSVTVAAVNDAPVIDSLPLTAATEDLAYQYLVSVNDPDNASLSWSLTAAPAGMAIGAATGVINWTPTNAQSGVSHAVTVQVSDGQYSTSQSFQIAVAAVNDLPVITTTAMTAAIEDVAYVYDVNATDVDNATLTWALATGPAGMTINTASGRIAWTPTNAQSGVSYPVTVTVTDGGASDAQSFSVAVDAVNDAPTLAALTTQTVTESSTLVFAALVSDPDDANDGSGALVWSIVAEDAPGLVSVDNLGIVSYTPGQGSAGSYSVTLRVADGGEDGAAAATRSVAIVVGKLDTDGDTIADYLDNCRTTANTDQLDTDLDGVAGGNGGSNGGNACDSDDDGDGIPDVTELGHLLDPLDAADAAGDLDGDGLSNLDEFGGCGTDLACAAIGEDSVGPSIHAGDDIVVVATGYYTPVTFTVTATDFVHGMPVNVVPRSDNTGPFRPGVHVVEWVAVDAEGNTSTYPQTVTVIPTITVGGSRIVGEGQTASLRVLLNGVSPQYPVTVSYALAGTTSLADHGVPLNGSVTINSGTETWLNIPLLNDGIDEGDEELVLTLNGVTAGSAALRTGTSTRVLVAANEVAPRVSSLWVEQGGDVRQQVYINGGTVRVTALAQDANGDALVYDWSTSAAALGGTAAGATFTFTPTTSSLTAGSYDVVVRVSDGTRVSERRLAIIVASALPVLSGSEDSDGDGVSDADEQLVDNDQDGLLDYLDPVDSPEQAALIIDNSVEGLLAVAVAEPGVVLAAGNFAAAQQGGGIQVPMSAVVDDGGLVVGDDGYVHVAGIYDVELRNVPANGRVAVILPLSVSLPPQVRWRQYINGEWFDFREGANDDIYSAPSVNGSCPAHGDAAWASGLLTGRDCVRLVLADGGANDADGEINGSVRLPSGPAVPRGGVPATAPSAEAGAAGFAWLGLLALLLWRRAGSAVGLLLMILAAGEVGAEEGESDWFIDGEAGITQDSNASRGAWTRDIIEDSVTGVSLGAAWNHEFNLKHALTLRGFVEAEQHADLPSLDHVLLGVQGIYRWQSVLGFTEPFWQASIGMHSDDVEGDLRDSDRYTVQLFRTRRVTDAFRYSLGGEGWYQEANGRVFDGSQVRLFINGDLSLTQRVALYATYSIASGDAVSSAQQVFCNGALSGDIYPLIDAAEEIEPDEALNADVCGTWLAYRLPALSHVGVGGINIGLGHRLSFDISVLHALVQAEDNIEYRRTLLRAGFLARF